MATTQQEKDFFAIVAEKLPASVNRLTSESDLWSFFMSLADKGSWSQGSGWTWTNTSTTTRMCESLVKRGLAVRTESGRAGYGTGYTLSTAASDLWRPFRQEIDRERGIRDKQRQYEHDLRWQGVHAREFAVKSLIEAHQAEYEGYIAQYIADNPVEEP